MITSNVPKRCFPGVIAYGAGAVFLQISTLTVWIILRNHDVKSINL